MHALIKATKKLPGRRLIFATEKYKRAKSLVLSRDRSKYFLFGGPILDSEIKFLKFVRIFWKNNVQEAYLPKMSILVKLLLGYML